ncbi:carboxymuconolactone decarboxylase family protein [Microbulbifer litoralis]|uniref:carboxymuconolactone decarboxylase family protein n=1 Tax=Microbulbifer litoralis TaxID=2933965 RepID=UPI002028C790|nr:carboxymuconolactone decarboxylase family protein [Microbulbifer sp. GX H0434]
MGLIPLMEIPVEDRVSVVFDEIRDELGAIPTLFRAHAHHPALLEANWYKFKALMIHGCLSAQLKEGIGLVISADNHCDYGIYHHSVSMENLGVARDDVMRIRNHPDDVHFSDKEQALFNLARHANLDPDNHGEKLIIAARELGARDDEIIEALGVMEMVVGFNHFASVLALEPQRDRT